MRVSFPLATRTSACRRFIHSGFSASGEGRRGEARSRGPTTAGAQRRGPGAAGQRAQAVCRATRLTCVGPEREAQPVLSCGVVPGGGGGGGSQRQQQQQQQACRHGYGRHALRCIHARTHAHTHAHTRLGGEIGATTARLSIKLHPVCLCWISARCRAPGQHRGCCALASSSPSSLSLSIPLSLFYQDLQLCVCLSLCLVYPAARLAAGRRSSRRGASAADVSLLPLTPTASAREAAMEPKAPPAPAAAQDAAQSSRNARVREHTTLTHAHPRSSVLRSHRSCGRSCASTCWATSRARP